ncbi:MAG: hypothetical protein U9N10_04885 [Bacillota bacterium]|nr:hypothetical protein [Bacillota bacterium]
MKKKILGKIKLNISVDFIDTARGYSVSEKYIGKALKEIDNHLILASKSPKKDYQGVNYSRLKSRA